MALWVVVIMMIAATAGCADGETLGQGSQAWLTYATPEGTSRTVRLSGRQEGIEALLGVVAGREELLECAIDEKVVGKMKAAHEHIELHLSERRLVTIAEKERKSFSQALFLLGTVPSDSDGVQVVLGGKKWYSGTYYGKTGRRSVLDAIRSLGVKIKE